MMAGYGFVRQYEVFLVQNGNETAHPKLPYSSTNSSSTAPIILGAAVLPNRPSYFKLSYFLSTTQNNQIVTICGISYRLLWSPTRLDF